VSELIHKSEEHSDYEYAKVDVHFVDIIDSVRSSSPPAPGRPGRAAWTAVACVCVLTLSAWDVHTG
jgi:hypothetical protein